MKNEAACGEHVSPKRQVRRSRDRLSDLRGRAMNLSELRPEPRRRQYCFGDFVLDIDGGFLRQGGQEIPLQPKAFEVLCYLVERHSRVVAKSDLMDAVWHDTA